MRAIVLAIGLIAAVLSSRASTLDTPSFHITIEERCGEYVIGCENVKYVGTSKISGKSITLIGKSIYHLGPDGVTPAHFLGYMFKNGCVKYFVIANGELRVVRKGRTIVEEVGVWFS